MKKNSLLAIAAGIGLLVAANSASALPALQLGGDGTTAWNYDTSDQTWAISESNFTLNAFANCWNTDDVPCNQNGDYAWDVAGSANQYAYLVAAAAPKTADSTDVFDLSISNDSSTLSLFTSGYGNPPLQDSNSLAGHGIYNTYFEIYQFAFDGSIGTIGNTQPGDSGTGDGYSELFDITINSLANDITGVHFDLFTVKDGGIYDLTSATDNKLVKSFAPFSHDAEYSVPEPDSLALIGIGLLAIGLGSISRRRKS